MQGKSKIPQGEEAINGDLVRELLREHGWKQRDISIKFFHRQKNYLSAHLYDGYLDSEYIDILATLLKIDRKKLLADSKNPTQSPVLLREKAAGSLTLEQCFYNLATSIESALTSFRHDLMTLKEVSDGEL